MAYRIGIDVGGTNTDAVIIDEKLNVLSKAKHPTTEDVTTGIFNVIEKVVSDKNVDTNKIEYAMLGTTHCTNAIVERKNLNKVLVIRLGKPATSAVKPLTGWPEDLKSVIGNHQYIVHGGHEFDGRKISELKDDEIREVAREVKGKVSSVAITSVFSPVNGEFEQRAKEILQDELGENINFSLSHEIGSIGLVERENATVLNASVVDVAKKATKAFENALKKFNINAKQYFGQNDGTLMAIEYAIKYPILTIACGPTNSIRGACFLTDQKEGLVVDVGGTTTDIGILNKGFPRQSTISVEIGGVRTNFRMPDLLSLGLGGGTIIQGDAAEFSIGPASVGYQITNKSQVFGGDTLTTTDIAVAGGIANVGDSNNLNDLDSELVSSVYQKMTSMIEVSIDKMKTESTELPVILVGGGSILFPDKLAGASKVYKPNHYEVANAIGAAISQVSGEVERIYNLSDMSREEAVEQAKQKAISEAIKAGAAEETVEIVDVEDVPLAYLPGNATRIKAKAAGDLLIE
ncbi:hydantoinase/oxoprolinase family protein [Natranaerobius thermophilus]|uniref:Hydantoinase/oxoprolinase n=1 Tax=Natranaerobius thermophilus (strain ATCC BAA-1301 / DSM 18059 / JW/NM-WN-LF) TaxID=457570 RepID=B2A884_NATTJ|nr:hydantoinase/oxoprolinase family protein [Natranaerobius thermophilus]ACB84450.1 Hydantoinase/oxoprolinase [Natranaerobius thermophilus JW/NM-WN-LF]